ncbi:dienelactone hydrolase family protein [Mycolicibacterium farcinogenes]|uniref:Dienelactone hydrolase family protein n=1 Tax=Mycolicibacterium farcinogenes TaxID=1802 RepID=A0ACD1FQR7_MYCFR|nr:dienelactone hydrolase family protein [Mycolicibacterium farcinogenes]QZH69396.1 dienelactone hydrolase family protein [Mycolicibacterium farcinogenes]
MADDRLDDFSCGAFTHAGSTRTVFRLGSGPAVIVMAEMPGITPRVLEFARRLPELGCTAVVPHLFGVPGLDPNPNAHGKLAAATNFLGSAVRVCVSKEFLTLASGRTSPIVDWLRALAADEHQQCGGPGVAAVGMCLTGGFALAMAVDDRLIAPVLSQPSLPLPLTRQQRRSMDIGPDDLARVKQRCAHGLSVLGLRFRSDIFVPDERFAFLREQLGDSFIAVELDDQDANPAAALPPHSVLTEHLIDSPGTATHAALHQVLSFIRQRLVQTEQVDNSAP